MTVDRQVLRRKEEGYCDNAYKCENAGIKCEGCTRNWFYEEPDDWFMEIEVEEPLTEEEEKGIKIRTAGEHPNQTRLEKGEKLEEPHK